MTVSHTTDRVHVQPLVPTPVVSIDGLFFEYPKPVSFSPANPSPAAPTS